MSQSQILERAEGDSRSGARQKEFRLRLKAIGWSTALLFVSVLQAHQQKDAAFAAQRRSGAGAGPRYGRGPCRGNRTGKGIAREETFPSWGKAPELAWRFSAGEAQSAFCQHQCSRERNLCQVLAGERPRPRPKSVSLRQQFKFFRVIALSIPLFISQFADFFQGLRLGTMVVFGYFSALASVSRAIICQSGQRSAASWNRSLARVEAVQAECIARPLEIAIQLSDHGEAHPGNSNSNSNSNSNNNNLRGGRHASTRVVPPYRGPVITGKPEIMLAPPPLRVLPIPASCPMLSGYFMCMAPSSTEDAQLEVWT